MSERKQELQVVALESDTVIDHIPSEKLSAVVSLLGLKRMSNNVTADFNFRSEKLGTRGIIRIVGKFLCDEEINRIAVVAPDVKLNAIHGYEVMGERGVNLSDELYGIVEYANPKCIANNEPTPTLFHVADKGDCVVEYHYCEKEQKKEEIEIV